MTKLVSGVEKYPQSLFEVRYPIEMNVVSCIAKDLLLLDEHDFKPSDFLTQDGAFYFSVFRRVRDSGVNVLAEADCYANVAEQTRVGLDSRGGWLYIKHMIDTAVTENFPAYVALLERENTIFELYKLGFDMTRPIVLKGKKMLPLAMFREMQDASSVLDWYESKLSAVGDGYSKQILEEEMLDFDDAFIDSCLAGEENGVPFDVFEEDINGNEINCLPFLSRQMNGYMPGTFNVLGGFSSVGKTSMWITIIMGLLRRDQKVLIISNEQKAKVFKIALIVWLLRKKFNYTGITRSRLQNGAINGNDRRMIKQVQDYWQNSGYNQRVKFISIPDANMSVLKKKVRENVLRYGFNVVLYDTLKCDFSDASADDKEYVRLIKDSRLLDQIAKRYNIIVLASMQLALASLGKLWLDASTLSMSKAVKEVCETLLLMRSVYADEIDPKSKFYCHPFRREQDASGKIVEREYEVDRTSTWRMLFVDKNRNGQDSIGDGVAYLLKFRGQFCTFSESFLCRPKHGNIHGGS